jgi:transcriptional regulator with XRE-family HTH domain
MEELKKFKLATLRQAAHLSQPYLAQKIGVCVSRLRQMENAGDPRVLTAILQTMLDCDDEKTLTLREAYHLLMKH